jgi:hypothetical protein
VLTAVRTYYRVCTRIRASELPAHAVDAMLIAFKPDAVDNAVLTFRRQLCDDRQTAEMLLRTARAEFPKAEHWLQIVRFTR